MSDVRRGHEADVAAVIEAINLAWQEGRPDDVGAHLHPDMVTVLPGFQGRVEGAQATVRSYRDFCRDARVHDFRVDDLHVHVVLGTAVATYAFRVDYEHRGRRLQEEGHEIQVLVREEAGWRSAWRTIVARPPG